MKTFKLATLILAGFMLFAPAYIVRAQDNTNKQPFCQNVEAIGGNMLTSMESKRQVGNSANFDSQVQIASQKLSKARLEADRVRNRHFELIIIKVKEPSQKQAVQNYRDAISGAIDTRRSSVDAAQAEFIANLTELINKHRQAVVQDEDELIGKVKQSIEDAKGSCTANPQALSVRSQLATELKLAKADFAIKKQSQSRHSLNYRQLVVNRNIAAARAISSYQQSEQLAKQQFLSEVKLNR